MASVEVTGNTEIVATNATTHMALVTAAGTDTNTFFLPAQANAVKINIEVDAEATDSVWVLIGSVDGSTWREVGKWAYTGETTFQITTGSYSLPLATIRTNSPGLSNLRYFALGYTTGTDTYTAYATPGRI